MRAKGQDGIDQALVYDALAEAEGDERVARILKRLAAVERAHGEVRARIAGGARPSLEARGLAWLGKHVGPAMLLPMLADQEGERDARDRTERARLVQKAAAKEGGLPGQTLAQLEG
ncbi:MAG TPA: hypothetical protein VHX64_06240, partial [Caulobacteraceae bacterium]|nr:hypothetical protein [Caulobacteraceae bacterium]